MEKKIIAIALVLILMVTAFVGCKKKEYLTIDSKGKEYVLATDENGSTRVNEEGDLIIYPTDSNGEFYTNEDGSYQENNLEYPYRLVEGNQISTRGFVFVMPLEGWTTNANGKVTKDGSDGKSYVQVVEWGEMGENEDLSTITRKLIDGNNDTMNKISKKYPNTKMNIGDAVITDRNVKAITSEIIVKDEAGKVIYYAHGTYFITNEVCYKVEHVCFEGQYYDETIDWIDVINKGLVVKGKAIIAEPETESSTQTEEN